MENTSTDVAILSRELFKSLKRENVELSSSQKRLLKETLEGLINPPTGHMRKTRNTHARVSKAAIAAHTIKGFDQESDLVALTYGQFSLIDLIQATLDITGAADVTIATWSTGFYDLEAAKNFQRDGRIRSIKFIMDSGRNKSGQAGVTDIADLFGEDSIITVRTHAKFVLITNEDWNIVITSSMNLNKNIRCEQFEMTNDKARHDMFTDFVRTAFEEVPENRSFGFGMPQMKTISDEFVVQGLPQVARSTAKIRTGRVSLSRDAG